jgi:hypothetical protein
MGARLGSSCETVNPMDEPGSLFSAGEHRTASDSKSLALSVMPELCERLFDDTKILLPI